jgi:hypothetical protein
MFSNFVLDLNFGAILVAAIIEDGLEDPLLSGGL